MSHMTKEERKANNIRNETQRRIDAGDTSSYVQNQIRNNPDAFTNVQPNQQDVTIPTEDQQTQYKTMADSMKEVGIRGVSGRTTDDDKGEKAREIQLDYLADRDQTFYTPYEDKLLDFGSFSDVPPEGRLTETAGDPLKQKIVSNILRGKPSKDKVPLIDRFDNFMTSFGGKKLNIPFPSIATFGASALEGMNATNVLLNKLNKGLELDSSDKVAVVTLVNKLRENNKINPSYDKDIANILDNYAKENELSTDEMFDLTSKFNKQFAEIEGKVEGEDSNISDYIDRMNNMSFGETVGTMYGDLTGQRDTSGITTLENITDNLGTEGLAYLKLTDPKTYYRLRPAQTSDQMRDLANVAMPTGGSPEDRRFAAQIMEAREMAARSKESQDRASGIMTASSAPPVPPPVIPPVIPPVYPEGYGAFLLNPPAPVRPGGITQPGFPDQDGDGVDDRYQAGPGIPRPGIENVGLGIGSPKMPGDKMNIPAAFDYASIAPQFTGSQYTNQGVSPAFLENLRRFYG